MTNHFGGLPVDHSERLVRARLALEGLSVGDAFGECFFGGSETIAHRLEYRQVPPSPWWYTDDTVMAVSIYRCLAERGGIDQNLLAKLFADEYRLEPRRGYGGTAHSILRAIGEGVPWSQAAGEAFSGMGSMGNGGAMRVAPLGAYFTDDLPALVENARRSAEVTHAHSEGQAGAIAVACAAAWAWQHRAEPDLDRRDMLRFAIEHTPEGETHTGLRRAMALPFDRDPQIAAHMLGNGLKVTSPDTVPLALWCAARHWRNYPDAIWAMVSAFGDIDTNCAIVGGIVALSAVEDIPADWIAARGSLPLL